MDLLICLARKCVCAYVWSADVNPYSALFSFLFFRLLSSFIGFIFTHAFCWFPTRVMYVQTTLVCVRVHDSVFMLFMFEVSWFVCCFRQCVRVCVRIFVSVPSEVCSQLWVGISQTAKRPAGKFPISQCSVLCGLTTEGSEIHSCSTTQLTLSLPSSPFSPSLSVSLDESEQRWKAFRNAGRQAVLYSNLTWGRWKPAGKLGIERAGRKVRGRGGQDRVLGKKEWKGEIGRERVKELVREGLEKKGCRGNERQTVCKERWGDLRQNG